MYYSLFILLANVSINLPIGPLIIIAIIGLKLPSKDNFTSELVSDTSFISAVRVKGNLAEAAPRITLFGATFSFIFSLISGIPLSPKIKESSPVTSNFAVLSGINFSKFFTSVKESNKSWADFCTVTFGLSKFIFYLGFGVFDKLRLTSP